MGMEGRWLCPTASALDRPSLSVLDRTSLSGLHPTPSHPPGAHSVCPVLGPGASSECPGHPETQHVSPHLPQGISGLAIAPGLVLSVFVKKIKSFFSGVGLLSSEITLF